MKKSAKKCCFYKNDKNVKLTHNNAPTFPKILIQIRGKMLDHLTKCEENWSSSFAITIVIVIWPQ